MNERILLVEDDRSLRETTSMLLVDAGMSVVAAPDGQAALTRFRGEPFDAVVLDIMLPIVDGLDVCRTMRKTSNVPIVMLTAKSETTDLVVGLELGADDYVTKPFDPPALIARLKAVLRRATGETHAPTLTAGTLRVDPVGFIATKDDAVLDLSATEFKLLVELMRHAGQVLTRDVLLSRVWEYDYRGDSRMVDMAVKRLRGKLEDGVGGPRLITTVRGIGYRFDSL